MSLVANTPLILWSTKFLDPKLGKLDAHASSHTRKEQLTNHTIQYIQMPPTWIWVLPNEFNCCGIYMCRYGLYISAGFQRWLAYVWGFFHRQGPR